MQEKIVDLFKVRRISQTPVQPGSRCWWDLLVVIPPPPPLVHHWLRLCLPTLDLQQSFDWGIFGCTVHRDGWFCYCWVGFFGWFFLLRKLFLAGEQNTSAPSSGFPNLQRSSKLNPAVVGRPSAQSGILALTASILAPLPQNTALMDYCALRPSLLLKYLSEHYVFSGWGKRDNPAFRRAKGLITDWINPRDLKKLIDTEINRRMCYLQLNKHLAA